MSKLAKLFLSMSFLALVFNSCVKTDIDEPPYNTNYPTYNANFSIKQLKAMHTLGGFETITEDYIIKAVVVADDKTGNFYKTLVIQDSTAGIDLRINATNLFNIYPVGRRVYVKVKGMTIGDYNGNLQLGAGTYLDDNGDKALSSIEEPLLDNYLIKGEFNIPVIPTVRTLSELGPNDENTLIQLNGMEVADADLGKTYADFQINSNRTFKDCSNKTVTVRTSGYSTFALKGLPQGNGSMVAIYTVFGTTKQLFVRDTVDLQLNGTRCGGGGTGGELINVSDVRALFQGSALNLPADKKIKGIVISDKTFSNITSKNLVLWQQGNAGLTIRFAETSPFNVGDELEVGIGGVELSEFSGLLQLNNVPLANVSRTGTGKSVTPTQLTIQALNANINNYESQLVKIIGVTLSKSGGNTYSGDVTMTDATGSISMYSTTYATFAGDAIPTGVVEVVGIAGQGGASSANQINIRSKADIIGGTIVDPEGDIDESFTGGVVNQDISIGGWLNVAEKGTRKWIYKSFSGNFYAQATAYNSTDDENVTWLISPGVVLDKPKLLTFETALQVYKHDGLQVLASTNFDGTNYLSATWTPIVAPIAGASTGDNIFVPSGSIDLSAFTGKIYIAFKYSGTASANTTSYRIDNVKIFDK